MRGDFREALRAYDGGKDPKKGPTRCSCGVSCQHLSAAEPHRCLCGINLHAQKLACFSSCPAAHTCLQVSSACQHEDPMVACGIAMLTLTSKVRPP